MGHELRAFQYGDATTQNAPRVKPSTVRIAENIATPRTHTLPHTHGGPPSRGVTGWERQTPTRQRSKDGICRHSTHSPRTLLLLPAGTGLGPSAQELPSHSQDSEAECGDACPPSSPNPSRLSCFEDEHQSYVANERCSSVRISRCHDTIKTARLSGLS